MRLLKTNLIGAISICLLLLVALNSATGQSSMCDPCNNPWGPSQQKTYTNQTVQGLSSACTFDIILEIQTRNCNGIIQVRLIDYYIQSNNGPGCLISCWHVGLLMRKATKLLLQSLGGHIVVNKPASCYYTLEFEPTPQFIKCVGHEINNFNNWYQVIPCGQSCCVTEYELLPSGEVATLSSISDPCMGTPPNPIPATITIICGGTPMVVPVIPPSQPLTCEPTCDNSGDIFSAKLLDVDDFNEEEIVHIYPNPAGQVINIANWERWTDIKIFDVAGKLTMNSKLTQKSIDVSKLGRGYYQIILSNEKSKVKNISKFIKD